MLKEIQDTLNGLAELYQKILAQPLLPKGASFHDDWPGWGIFMEKSGVYILWATAGGINSGQPPIYIGEGMFGPRIWEHFRERPEWTHAQMLPDDVVPGTERERQFWRKALERVCILALDPVQNRD